MPRRRNLPSILRIADVWIPHDADASRFSHRRIVQIDAGRVIYSFGGDHARVCKISTFQRFTRRARLEFRMAAPL